MRSSALIALLPLLATGTGYVQARPHHHDHHHSGRHSMRKSLGFGPVHKHASFESIPLDPLSEVEVQGLVERDPVVVAKEFIQRQLGVDASEGFYIREDTYTDRTTGITHVFARQLIAGLEVGDGDINVNVDRHGRIMSWGNSFHPDPSSVSTELSPSTETSKLCDSLRESMDAHRSLIQDVKGEEGVWAMVKSAAQIVLPGVIAPPKVAELDRAGMGKLYKQMRHYKHHHEAICQQSGEGAIEPLDPVSALVSLLPRLSTNLGLIDSSDFISTSDPSLQAKPAYGEPPTQHISGPGLAKAGIKNAVPARFMWTQTSDQPRLVWKMEVEMQDNWYEAYVDVASGDLLRIVDWAKDYTWGSRSTGEHQVEVQKGGKQKPLPSPEKKYKPYTYGVFPWGVNDPTVGNFTTVTEPWDTTASPLGWHTIPTSANPWTAKLPGMHVNKNETVFHTTAGNNVIAHEDWEGQNNYLLNYRPVNDSMVFVYDYGEYEGLAPKEYIDMVVTQLFYTSNMYHDLLYRLGFDELAGNFQAHNFGLGGRGGDPVTCNAQDGSGYNNANFMTPPDGQAPRMRMYVWDTATPYRDGDVEAGIVIHEYSHGLSTRLTGGPANSGCLGFGEAGGMGEGWGDAIATLIRQIEEHKNFSNGTDVFSMGAWAANRDAGIRNYKYSTNSTSNPSTYKTLDKPGYWGVHAIGEVWAEILFVMSQRLVEKYGFSSTLFPPTDVSKPNDYYTQTSLESIDSAGKPVPLVPKHGNTLALQLIISAMKIQPCRPSFFDARDAIIQSDQILTGGENTCLIWKAFAERGLGADAKVIGQTPWGGGVRSDGFKVPTKACEDKQPKH